MSSTVHVIAFQSKQVIINKQVTLKCTFIVVCTEALVKQMFHNVLLGDNNGGKVSEGRDGSRVQLGECVQHLHALIDALIT